MICSEDVYKRIVAEADQLIENIQAVNPSVGDGAFVLYDEAFAQKHGIGRCGRMTIKEGKKKFHAAHSTFDSKQYHHYDDVNVMPFVKDWQQGRDLSLPVDRLSPQPDPKPVTVTKKYRVRTYERALLAALRHQREVTLVNPSYGAMAELKSLGGGFVSLTATVDHAWRREVKKFIRNSQGRLKLLPHLEIRGVAYLGSNHPMWFPSHDWVRLVVSPCVEGRNVFLSSKVTYLPDMVHVQYEKKPGYFVSNSLLVNSPHYVYNAPTVDLALGQKEQLFLIESSSALTIVDVEDKRLFHSPWFIDHQGTWQKIGTGDDEIEARVSNGLVYDVDEPGTYMSKRCRISLPDGYSWAPLQENGTHWVTMSTCKPLRLYGLEKVEAYGTKFLCMDHTIPIFGVRKVNCDDNVGFAFDPDGCLAYVQNPTNHQKRLHPYAYESSEGYLFSASQQVTAALYCPPLMRVSADHLMLKELQHVNGYITPKGFYVDCEIAVGCRHVFVMTKISDIDRMTTLLMPYARPGSYTHIVQTAKNDNAIEGEMSQPHGETRIRDYLEKVCVYSAMDQAPTIAQISRDLDLLMPYVHRVLCTDPSYVYWWSDIDAGTEPIAAIPSCQFVLAKNVLVPQPGQIVEGDGHNVIDGRLWSDIYRTIGLYSVLESRTGHIRKFVRFLERNMFKVKIDRTSSICRFVVISPFA